MPSSRERGSHQQLQPSSLARDEHNGELFQVPVPQGQTADAQRPV